MLPGAGFWMCPETSQLLWHPPSHGDQFLSPRLSCITRVLPLGSVVVHYLYQIGTGYPSVVSSISLLQNEPDIRGKLCKCW